MLQEANKVRRMLDHVAGDEAIKTIRPDGQGGFVQGLAGPDDVDIFNLVNLVADDFGRVTTGHLAQSIAVLEVHYCRIPAVRPRSDRAEERPDFNYRHAGFVDISLSSAK